MEFMYVRLWRALISRFALTSAEVRVLRNYLSLTPFSALLLRLKLTVGSIPSLSDEGRCVGKHTFCGRLEPLTCAIMPA